MEEVTKVLITRREVAVGAAVPALTTAIPATPALATRPRQLFAYVALAARYGQPRWQRPVLLLHNGEFLTGRLVASIGLSFDTAFLMYALEFGDIAPIQHPFPRELACACVIDVCDSVEK